MTWWQYVCQYIEMESQSHLNSKEKLLCPGKTPSRLSVRYLHHTPVKWLHSCDTEISHTELFGETQKKFLTKRVSPLLRLVCCPRSWCQMKMVSYRQSLIQPQLFVDLNTNKLRGGLFLVIQRWHFSIIWLKTLQMNGVPSICSIIVGTQKKMLIMRVRYYHYSTGLILQTTRSINLRHILPSGKLVDWVLLAQIRRLLP